MYEYRASVLKVVDGDTVYLSVDLGCDVTTKMACRLYGINSPEMRTPEGVAAREYTLNWFTTYCPDGLLMVHTIKDKREKYGRYLARLYPILKHSSPPMADTSLCLNDLLVDSNNAKVYPS